MDTDAWRVVEPWTQDGPPPEGGGFFNIGQPVRCCYLLWAGMTRGISATASWAVIWPAGNNEPKIPACFSAFLPLALGSSGIHWCWRQRTTGVLLSRECETPHLLMVTSEFDGDSDRKKDYSKFRFSEGMVKDIWEIIQMRECS